MENLMKQYLFLDFQLPHIIIPIVSYYIEILCQPQLLNFLYGLFNVCFRKGIVPSDWAKSNIKPIPKPGKDSMVPLNNRGISLMSTVAKVYNSILNQRLCIYTAITNTLSDEQNGFRKNRSCLDHLFSLTAIIRYRKLTGYPTYTCFVDFSKAFDSVSRNCLFHKLLVLGLCGKFYKALLTIT